MSRESDDKKTDVCYSDATQLAFLIRTKQVSPREAIHELMTRSGKSEAGVR